MVHFHLSESGCLSWKSSVIHRLARGIACPAQHSSDIRILPGTDQFVVRGVNVDIHCYCFDFSLVTQTLSSKTSRDMYISSIMSKSSYYASQINGLIITFLQCALSMTKRYLTEDWLGLILLPVMVIRGAWSYLNGNNEVIFALV